MIAPVLGCAVAMPWILLGIVVGAHEHEITLQPRLGKRRMSLAWKRI
jgi:hypothetical protein